MLQKSLSPDPHFRVGSRFNFFNPEVLPNGWEEAGLCMHSLDAFLVAFGYCFNGPYWARGQLTEDRVIVYCGCVVELLGTYA